MLENLQKQQAEWNESEEAAADGDQAVIDFEGFIDGEAFEGGKATGYTLNLGSGSMIPGFEEGVVGMPAASAGFRAWFPSQRRSLQRSASRL